jgi:ubiquinol-cytochrome c reductase cytochrome b subunit
VDFFTEAFGGSVYYDKAQNGYWKWAVQSKENVSGFKDYLKKYPRRSTKRMKISLVSKVYKLLALRAHLNNNSAFHNPILHKEWNGLIQNWQNLSKNPLPNKHKKLRHPCFES